MKNENNKGSEDSISENESNLDDILGFISNKNEENPLFVYFTQEELDLLRNKLQELKKSPQTVQEVEVPVKKM